MKRRVETDRRTKSSMQGVEKGQNAKMQVVEQMELPLQNLIFF